jgi:hypothetical protein
MHIIGDDPVTLILAHAKNQSDSSPAETIGVSKKCSKTAKQCESSCEYQRRAFLDQFNVASCHALNERHGRNVIHIGDDPVTLILAHATKQGDSSPPETTGVSKKCSKTAKHRQRIGKL